MKLFFLKGIKEANVCLDIKWGLANESFYDRKQCMNVQNNILRRKSLVTAFILRLKFGKQKYKSKT